jgi:hypothetical protein
VISEEDVGIRNFDAAVGDVAILALGKTIAQLSSSNRLERGAYMVMLASGDAPPPYRFKWNLGKKPNFAKGIRYIAELNSKEPVEEVRICCGVAGDFRRWWRFRTDV